MGFTRRIAAILLPTLFPLALHLDASRAAAQEAQGATVTGQVRDVGTSEPLMGAVVEVPDHRLRAVTDSAGSFVLRGVPAGEQRWTIRRLGYTRWEESTAVQDGANLVIGLLASPLALDEIRATGDRIERRRRMSTRSVRAIDRKQILTSAAANAYELVAYRALPARTVCPARAGTGSVGNLSAAGDLCVMSRGRVSPVGVCIDEMKASPEVLAVYPPQDIYAIEAYDGGRSIRVYTNWFVETGQPLRALIAGCM
jgi:hypothetical protein